MRSALAILALVAASCAGGDGERDSGRETRPNAASLIPIAPAPQPTPTPVGQEPSEDPLPATPSGGDGDGTDAGTCGPPVPPSITLFWVDIFSRSGSQAQLDSTPLVGPDAEYCRLIGYTDGRVHCPVRPEGHPERLACEAAGVGLASDTARVGPTWTANGSPCDRSEAPGSCWNHPSNQFQVYVFPPGLFQACAQNGACGEIRID